jgi:hypothetical protein
MPRADLDLNSTLQRLPLLLRPRHRLRTHNPTAPMPPALLMLARVPLTNRRHQLTQLALILPLHLRECQHSSSLLVHHRPESRFTLDDGVGDTHLSAESGEEDNELDGVDVVGDQDESGLFVLDESDDVVEAVFHGVGLLAGVFLLLTLAHGSGFGVQTLLLLCLGFWTVLVEEFEGLCGGVAVEGVLELGDGGWDFEAEVEDLALALEEDVFWPSLGLSEMSWVPRAWGDNIPDHARQVSFRLDILTDAEVAGSLLEERVLQVRLASCRFGFHLIETPRT